MSQPSSTPDEIARIHFLLWAMRNWGGGGSTVKITEFHGAVVPILRKLGYVTDRDGMLLLTESGRSHLTELDAAFGEPQNPLLR